MPPQQQQLTISKGMLQITEIGQAAKNNITSFNSFSFGYSFVQKTYSKWELNTFPYLQSGSLKSMPYKLNFKILEFSHAYKFDIFISYMLTKTGFDSRQTGLIVSFSVQLVSN